MPMATASGDPLSPSTRMPATLAPSSKRSLGHFSDRRRCPAALRGGNDSGSSLPGLTRQSIVCVDLFFMMDARAKPAHDESEVEAGGARAGAISASASVTASAATNDSSAARGGGDGAGTSSVAYG